MNKLFATIDGLVLVLAIGLESNIASLNLSGRTLSVVDLVLLLSVVAAKYLQPVFTPTPIDTVSVDKVE